MPARILVIEDNPTNMELMTFLLRSFGHTTLSASDGNGVLDLLRQERPNLVLCDVQLPGRDGYEIAREVKADKSLQHIPLIAVTAYAMVGDRERLLSMGFDGYIAKPIDPETFIDRVHSFLLPEQRGAAAALAETAQAAVPVTVRNGAKVLVVDDSEVNLNLMRTLLAPNGFEVITSATIEDGLAAARTNRPDIIVSDVHLAHRSGYELVTTLSNDPELRSIPCIMISSTSTDASAESKALQAGAKLFIMRPIDPEDLLAEISKHVPCGK
ncbi:MAG TPA: response regulator [Terriglobales bacterium]|jgi:two-component system cell cycle response regulator|nr:response regulator [Terriglobales bacterium]